MLIDHVKNSYKETIGSFPLDGGGEGRGGEETTVISDYHSTGLGHQHGHRFIVLGHQYGGCDASHVKTLYSRNTAV